MPELIYTLVQHTGFSVGGRPDFRHAVESKSIARAESKKVVEAGGLVFFSYSDAEDLAEHINYPPEVRGIVPRCRGTFSDVTVSHLPVYVPTEYCRGPLTVKAVMES